MVDINYIIFSIAWILCGIINIFLFRRIAHKAHETLRESWYFVGVVFIMGMMGTFIIVISNRLIMKRWKI